MYMFDGKGIPDNFYLEANNLKKKYDSILVIVLMPLQMELDYKSNKNLVYMLFFKI